MDAVPQSSTPQFHSVTQKRKRKPSTPYNGPTTSSSTSTYTLVNSSDTCNTHILSSRPNCSPSRLHFGSYYLNSTAYTPCHSTPPLQAAVCPLVEDVSMTPTTHSSPIDIKRRSLNSKFRTDIRGSIPLESVNAPPYSTPAFPLEIPLLPSYSGAASTAFHFHEPFSDHKASSNTRSPCPNSLKHPVDNGSPFKYPPRRLAFSNRRLFSFPSSFPEFSVTTKTSFTSPPNHYPDCGYVNHSFSASSPKKTFSSVSADSTMDNVNSLCQLFPHTSTPKANSSISIGAVPMILSTPDFGISQNEQMKCKPSPFYKPELYKPSPDRIVIDESGVTTPPSQAPVPYGLRTPRRPNGPKSSPFQSEQGQKPPSVRRLFANLIEQSSLYASSGTKIVSPRLDSDSPNIAIEIPAVRKSTQSPSKFQSFLSRCSSSSSFFCQDIREESSPLSKRSAKSAAACSPSSSRVLTRSAAKKYYSLFDTPEIVLEKPSRGKLVFKACDSPSISPNSITSEHKLIHTSPLRLMSNMVKNEASFLSPSFSSPYHLRKTPQRELRSVRQSNSFFAGTKTAAAHCI